MVRQTAIGVILLTTLGLLGPIEARGQEPKAAPADSIAAIDAEFEREMLKLEKVRLDRLAKLAASKTGAEADRAYELYFRSAIATNLYADASPVADLVLKGDSASPHVAMMAQLVRIVAMADRGAYPESLASLESALKESKAGRKTALPTEMKLTLADAYLQKLLQGGQYDIAAKAVRTLVEKTEDPALKDLLSRRLKPLELVGKPAPAIEGTDVDGKPYRLADAKGNVVLVVFWATWSTANAQELAALEKAYETYRAKGFRIVGVNLDAFQEDGRTVESHIPNIKRFLIERNVRWPNVVERPGDKDLAKAFGVTDIPANVLIGRDGKVVGIDLTRANFNTVLASEIAR